MITLTSEDLKMIRDFVEKHEFNPEYGNCEECLANVDWAGDQHENHKLDCPWVKIMALLGESIQPFNP